MEQKMCVLACVTAQKDCARLIREGSRLALERGASLQVLHVAREKNAGDVLILDELFSLAHEVSAEVNILYEQDVASAIVRYARQCGAAALVLGPDRSGTTGRVRQMLPEDVQIVNMQ